MIIYYIFYNKVMPYFVNFYRCDDDGTRSITICVHCHESSKCEPFMILLGTDKEYDYNHKYIVTFVVGAGQLDVYKIEGDNVFKKCELAILDQSDKPAPIERVEVVGNLALMYMDDYENFAINLETYERILDIEFLTKISDHSYIKKIADGEFVKINVESGTEAPFDAARYAYINGDLLYDMLGGRLITTEGYHEVIAPITKDEIIAHDGADFSLTDAAACPNPLYATKSAGCLLQREQSWFIGKYD